MAFIALIVSCSKEIDHNQINSLDEIQKTEFRTDDIRTLTEDPCEVEFHTDWITPPFGDNIWPEWMDWLNNAYGQLDISCGGCHLDVTRWERIYQNGKVKLVFYADCEDEECERSFEDCASEVGSLCLTAGLGETYFRAQCYWVLDCQELETFSTPIITGNGFGSNPDAFTALGLEYPDGMTCPY